MTQDVEAEIRQFEDRRNRALMGGDLPTLESLITDDLVHIHTTGVVEDKAAYLHGIATRLKFIHIDRPSLAVRVLGHVAIATGQLHQTLLMRATGETIKTSSITTQVWVRNDSVWRQSSFQATRIS